MSTLVYGPASFPITIDLTQTNEFSRVPIFSDDGADYLYTEFVIDVVGIFHALWPGTQFGDAGITDLAVRSRLLRPRQPLVYSMLDTVLTPPSPPTPGTLLVSPVGGQATDAKNGPQPVFCNVSKVIGDANTFIVNYRIKTWMNECIRTDNAFFSLISNRWSMMHHIEGEDYRTIRTISGEARFDTGRLAQTALYADQLRATYMRFPIPLGFKRTSIDVTAAPDGSACAYTVVDTEMPVRVNSTTTTNPNTLASNGITNIATMEMMYSHGVSEDSIFDKGIDFMINMAQWAGPAFVGKAVPPIAAKIQRRFDPGHMVKKIFGKP